MSRARRGTPDGGGDAPVQDLPGVGSRRAATLATLRVRTVDDLLRHYPRRHEDRRHFPPLGELPDGECGMVRGTVVAASLRWLPGRRALVTARVRADDGVVNAMWFNQPYLARRLKEAGRVILWGRVERRGPSLRILNPEWEAEAQDGRGGSAGAGASAGVGPSLHLGRIVPVYPTTAGISQRMLRTLVWRALDLAPEGPDPLPDAVRAALDVAPAATARRDIHFPPDEAALLAARRRIAAEEAFMLRLGVALRRRRRAAMAGLACPPAGELEARVLAALPFALTAAQQRAAAEVGRDMERPCPMLRLLQGDVGSGKTVVAAIAAARAVEAGLQVAVMAPTVLLAEQHARTFQAILGRCGVKVHLLAGALERSCRRDALAACAGGEPGVVVGTHALIQEGVSFARLGLAVIDEQQRFGVGHCLQLEAKGPPPHVLVMTATPIPRTLALVAFGDVDVSTLDELPPGRRPPATVRLEAARRHEAYDALQREVSRGNQGYVVCPRIGGEGSGGGPAVMQVLPWLVRHYPGLRPAVVHGRLPDEEREAVVAAFRDGRLGVLVATTVVEVGVDVPEATVMIVEGAPGFGLSQLHQLRGRVGRSARPAVCFLIGDPEGELAAERLATLERTSDGFAVAEADLRLRGPGDPLGLRQHGLPDVHFPETLGDASLIAAADRAAAAIVAADPDLKSPTHAGLREAARRRNLDLLAPGSLHQVLG